MSVLLFFPVFGILVDRCAMFSAKCIPLRITKE